MTDEIEVTQADREAATKWLVNTPAVDDWCGYEDQRALVQAFARHRKAAIKERDAQIVAWLQELSGHPASALEGQPPRGEVWVLHRAADAIERGEV